MTVATVVCVVCTLSAEALEVVTPWESMVVKASKFENKFARPMRELGCMMTSKVVPFKIGGIQALYDRNSIRHLQTYEYMGTVTQCIVAPQQAS